MLACSADLLTSSSELDRGGIVAIPRFPQARPQSRHLLFRQAVAPNAWSKLTLNTAASASSAHEYG